MKIKSIFILLAIIVTIIVIPVFSHASENIIDVPNTTFNENTDNNLVESNIEEKTASEVLQDNIPSNLEATSFQKTDFSNAKFEIKKDSNSGAYLEVTGAEPISNHIYFAYLAPNTNSLPDFESTERGVLEYNSDNKKFIALGFAKYMEQNQDVYLYIGERDTEFNKDFPVKGVKLTRFEEPKYTEAFTATHLTYSHSQVVTKFTHDRKVDRKLNVKVGKIEDINILKKIKNQDVSGMKDLLAYAKTASATVNENATVSNRSFISYENQSGDKLININNIKDKEYYYLYVSADTENGKYVTQEAVTLGISDLKSSGEWYIFFYGDNNFTWIDFGETTQTTETQGEKTDNSTANKVLPATGKGILCIIGITGLVSCAVFLYDKNRKYEGI